MSVEEDFNAVAAIYDSVKYLPGPAERTAANAGLRTGQKVLDVACGTGFAAMAASTFGEDTFQPVVSLSRIPAALLLPRLVTRHLRSRAIALLAILT